MTSALLLRTYYYFDGTIRTIQGGDVEVETTEDAEKIVSVYTTPKGTLREVRKKSIKGLATKAVAPYWSEHLAKETKKRTAELHACNKLCTAHWDGKLKSLLRYARETGLDALECVTPQPQGDVMLEEIHSALGDMILFDGIPAISFLPWAKNDELVALTLNVLRLFLPHLILGVSDLVPPNADVEKIRLVQQLIEKWQS